MKTIDDLKKVTEFFEKDNPIRVYFSNCKGEWFDIDYNEISKEKILILWNQNDIYTLDCISDKISNDPVNHPSHYTSGKIEVIDFIEDQKLGFCLGNTVKYVARAGKKDPSKLLEDLNKAKWYLEREIQSITNKTKDLQ